MVYGGMGGICFKVLLLTANSQLSQVRFDYRLMHAGLPKSAVCFAAPCIWADLYIRAPWVDLIFVCFACTVCKIQRTELL